MTIAQYTAKFIKLAKFTSKLVENEETQARKFQMGLRAKIRKDMVPFKLITYGEIANTTLIIE